MPARPDHWRELCIAAAFEENPQKLSELVAEINQGVIERQEELADRIFEKLALHPAAENNAKHRIQ